jgi:hypothetical protein
MNLALSLSAFKKRFGLSQRQVNGLLREGEITIQQNGYKGDSLAHHKLILFPPGFQGSNQPKDVNEEFCEWFNGLPTRQRRILEYWLWGSSNRAAFKYSRRSRKIVISPPDSWADENSPEKRKWLSP